MNVVVGACHRHWKRALVGKCGMAEDLRRVAFYVEFAWGVRVLFGVDLYVFYHAIQLPQTKLPPFEEIQFVFPTHNCLVPFSDLLATWVHVYRGSRQRSTDREGDWPLLSARTLRAL
eukprot:201256-Rhodomonas_salina.1